MLSFRFEHLAALAGVIAYTHAYLTDPPTTAAPDTAQDCSNWGISSSGSTCESIADNWLITVDEFKSYNPSVGSACTLVSGNSYCVERNYGIPTETTKTSSSLKPTATNGITTPSPIQSGMVTNCNKFYYVAKGDGCYDIAASYSITLDQLYLWNPALDSCRSLWPDTYICVSIIGLSSSTTTTRSPTITSTPTSTKSTPTNGVATPTPYQSGLTTNCNKFYFVKEADTCYDIAKGNSISLDQFYGWNPAVGNTCATLWPKYYVCVGILGVTTSLPMTTIRTSTTSKFTIPQCTFDKTKGEYVCPSAVPKRRAALGLGL